MSGGINVYPEVSQYKFIAAKQGKSSSRISWQLNRNKNKPYQNQLTQLYFGIA